MSSPSISIFHDTRRTKLKTKRYPVKLRVYFNGRTKYFSTGVDLSKEEFRRSYLAERPRKELKETKQTLQLILSRALGIASELKIFSIERFQKKLLRPIGSSVNVFNYYAEVMNDLAGEERLGSYSNYDLSSKSLKAFLKSRGKSTQLLLFQEVDVQFLNEYENWMLKEKKSLTTVGIYLRPLRAVFNRALQEQEISSDIYPFGKRKYVIPQTRNVKKALSKVDLQKLMSYRIPQEHPMEKARDFFFFSYCVNGINVKDIVELKENNIHGEYVTFIRSKTKNTTRRNITPIIAALNSFAMHIIQKWGNKNRTQDMYVFSILNAGMNAKQRREATQAFTRFINQHMKTLAQLSGVDENISTYYARHSYSTISHLEHGLSLAALQECLGHQRITTTMNYIKGFEDETLKENASRLMDFSDAPGGFAS
jgi:site-specific recombinase XerD